MRNEPKITVYDSPRGVAKPSLLASPKPRALDVQEGGSHYKDMPVKPVEYIHKNGIGYFEGCVIKYVSRWRKKNGIEDLKKARHFLDLLIEFEAKQQEATCK